MIKTKDLQDQDRDSRPQDQDQDFQNSVSRRLETKTQVSRTPSLCLATSDAIQEVFHWPVRDGMRVKSVRYFSVVCVCAVVGGVFRLSKWFEFQHSEVPELETSS